MKSSSDSKIINAQGVSNKNPHDLTSSDFKPSDMTPSVDKLLTQQRNLILKGRSNDRTSLSETNLSRNISIVNHDGIKMPPEVKEKSTVIRGKQRISLNSYFIAGRRIKFLIKPVSFCSSPLLAEEEKKPLVVFRALFLIHSGADHFEHRSVIRDTWTDKSLLNKFQAKVIFVLGKSDLDLVETKVVEEAQTYQDILKGGEVLFEGNLNKRCFLPLYKN